MLYPNGSSKDITQLLSIWNGLYDWQQFQAVAYLDKQQSLFGAFLSYFGVDNPDNGLKRIKVLIF